jgi:hypothetical protein
MQEGMDRREVSMRPPCQALLLCAAGVLLQAVACSGSSNMQGQEPLSPAPSPPVCTGDADCTTVPQACCTCPSLSLSLPQAEDWLRRLACDDQRCAETPATGCAPVASRCLSGECVLEQACVPLRCTLSCAEGYESDAAGCGVCSCREGTWNGGPPSNLFAGCLSDADCIRVPLDCCGCEKGGVSTAVSQAAAGEHAKNQGCSTAPACSNVDACGPDVPRCLNNVCRLLPPCADTKGCEADDLRPDDLGCQTCRGSTSAHPCGTAAGLACPPGEVCVLNDPEEPFSRRHAGLCRPK